ncbi:hypothetical protein GIB67_034603 [Kingdonia uniflora]|uniref:Transmembrane protein n=1 Tax=Kingdonia uniflora TaxID=39325 RepID=A0A7J7MXG9_9MAGN|nr:hypothetical protein GIB67_034603 [Kingdonia uniflora]
MCRRFSGQIFLFLGLVQSHTSHTLRVGPDFLSTFVSLPPLFHEKKSIVALSPIVGGSFVPVSMVVGNGLITGQVYGVVGLRWVLMGRLRWKSGAFKSGRYGVYVKCDMLVGLRRVLLVWFLCLDLLIAMLIYDNMSEYLFELYQV